MGAVEETPGWSRVILEASVAVGGDGESVLLWNGVGRNEMVVTSCSSPVGVWSIVFLDLIAVPQPRDYSSEHSEPEKWWLCGGVRSQLG